MKKIVLRFVKIGAEAPENMVISAARRAKYECMGNEQARAQHMASSQAIYAIMGDRARTFRYGENGRPEVDGGYVSPAHTTGMAVCAYADAAVGCDIERHDREIAGAMKKHFADIYEWLAAEACVKLTGEGLAGLRRYRRCGDVMMDESGERVAYVRFLEYGEYRVAVCCGEKFVINIIE